MSSRTEPHVVDEAGAARATDIFTLAFHHDPVWAWAFPDDAHRASEHAVFWRFFVDCALEHDWIWLTGDDGAAALWLPPGCPEVPEADEEKVEPMLVGLVGDRQTEILLETFACFEQARPTEPPHYYLSLLGTHPDHRGRGLGMALVADNLDLIDAASAPAYLESTNPSNNHRYESLGFQQVGEFTLPRGGPVGGDDVA